MILHYEKTHNKHIHNTPIKTTTIFILPKSTNLFSKYKIATKFLLPTYTKPIN